MTPDRAALDAGFHDIDDLLSFARKQVGVYCHRMGTGKLSPDDWNELTNEAVCEIAALARTFDPERNDSFAGYASTYIPRRIASAHAKLVGVTSTPLDAVPEWQFGSTPDATEGDGEGPDDALLALPPHRRIVARALLAQVREGLPVDEAVRRWKRA